MVGLQIEIIARGESARHKRGRKAEIRAKSHFNATGLQGESNWIKRIVHHRKRMDLDISKLKTLTRGKDFKCGALFELGIDAFGGFTVGKNRNVSATRK